MDYVLFGMGYGSSLMLLGWALRTFGPHLKYSRPQKNKDAEFLVQRRFWVRFVQGLGGVIAIAGTTMVLMTFVVVLMNPSDETGMTISMVIWGFILAVVLIWCGLYISRFGLTGIWSRDGGYRFRSTSTVASRRRSVSPAPPSNNEMLITINDHAVLSEVSTAVGGDGIEDTAGSMPEEVDAEFAEAELSDGAVAGDPVYDFGDGSETTVPSDVGGRAEALRRLRQRQARSGQSSS